MDRPFHTYDDLKKLMERLRHPETGCPWDLEQTFETIKPHTIEEAYEVADAIERNDMDDLKDELGDLLFQVVFHSQMAAEQKIFDLDDVIDHVTAKMIFRHPHVFKDNTNMATASDVENTIWENQKEKEKKNSGKNTDEGHYLDNVTANLPSLLYAHKLQKKAYKTGFRYPSFSAVLDKLSEEIDELKQAYESGNADHINEEIGDVLLVSSLLATETRNNPEESLRKACHKLKNRFDRVEDDLAQSGLTLHDATIEDMTEAWLRIKDNNRKPL
tara:strand:+ start:1056 stop:1874 length:819 start_codon:yes stop_codon:yes gene_type:complete